MYNHDFIGVFALQIVSLSDCFASRQHFEWMLSTLLEVYRAHAPEDELVLQYLVVGICKAASVTGIVSRRSKVHLLAKIFP